MSYRPPCGRGHPPPPRHHPSRPGITYVPAPVMMPIPVPRPEPPPTQPTFVTNHYYQTVNTPQAQPQPPPPVAPPVVDAVEWATVTPSTASSYSHRAFVAGKEGWDGSPIWIIRAHHQGDFIPGKLAIKHRAAYIGHMGRELPVHNFDVMLAAAHTVHWVPSSDGQVPPNAIPAGNVHTGEPLYIARVSHAKSLTPGKLHASHGCAYIPFGGEELPFKRYEVLCKF